LKRALLLVFAAAMLLALSCRDSTNTKATPKPATSTDSVATNPDRVFALSLKADSQRKEVIPTPTPPPRPAPESLVSPREEEVTLVPNAEETTSQKVEAASTSVPSPAGEQPGQIVEGVWLTFYDCDVEDYCTATASGVTLKEGGTEERERYAACDPDYWPFGTRMTVIGDPNQYEWVCVDTGSAVIGPAHWDVWFFHQADGEAYLDAVGTTVTIKILP